jgi:hypothetical protein
MTSLRQPGDFVPLSLYLLVVGLSLIFQAINGPLTIFDLSVDVFKLSANLNLSWILHKQVANLTQQLSSIR